MISRTKNHRPTPAPELLRKADVLALTGIRSESTLKRLVRDGNFPRPVSIGKRSVAWRRAGVYEWIESRPLA